MSIPGWLSRTIVAIVSLLAAFFAVVNVLFSDHDGPNDAVIAVSYVFGLYLILSLVIHATSRRRDWTWFWWLVAPGLVLGGLFGAADGGWTDWYTWMILGAMVVAVTVGRMVMRPSRSKSQVNPTA